MRDGHRRRDIVRLRRSEHGTGSSGTALVTLNDQSVTAGGNLTAVAAGPATGPTPFLLDDSFSDRLGTSRAAVGFANLALGTGTTANTFTVLKGTLGQGSSPIQSSIAVCAPTPFTSIASAHQPNGASMRERDESAPVASFRLSDSVRRVRRGGRSSMWITTVPIACLAGLLACGGEPTTPPVAPPDPAPAQPASPISGAAVAGMAAYDKAITDLMQKYGIPGGAIAIVRDGRLFYARGFGYADVESEAPVQPDALFRIASVSKPITGVAVMKLVEEGKLQLDDRVAPFIAHLTPAPGATVDPRWEQITIRQLLNHTAGWDRAKPNGGFDPMFRPAIAAAAVGAPAPASAETVIRYMKGMPLDFNPGEKFAYSNFGYAILGRVIERVSGMPYEEYVRARVLQPAGANRTRQGRTRMGDALAGEVRYYVPGAGPNATLAPSVFPGEGPVPVAYGGFYLEAMDSHGGWVSSSVDLLRFLTAVDGRANRPDILSAGLVAEMTSDGAPASACPAGECYYAGGWLVRPTQGDATWWHTGALGGTTSVLVRSYSNISWVALFNARPTTGNLIGELDDALGDALAQMTSFPTHDLFSTFQ